MINPGFRHITNDSDLFETLRASRKVTEDMKRHVKALRLLPEDSKEYLEAEQEPLGFLK